MISLGGHRDSQTICAVSTPPGYGGISVIRLSGENSVSIVKKCISHFPENLKSHSAHYGNFVDPKTGQHIDQVVALFFQEGKSYTGEETLELSCHGSPIICERILKVLIEQGAKPALPGEFTYRAFMNNRIDLVQAESVLSLIESRSQKSAEMSLKQLEGHLSNVISQLESDLTWCLAHIEAGIDFSTEGLDVIENKVLIDRLGKCQGVMKSLLETYQKGKTLREGVQIALIGQPNVGKSSLLNLILGFDRAIVTNKPGTTRDVVEADIVFEGIRFVFQDTAGLRDEGETQDEIEVMGMKRSQEAAKRADLILFCYDLAAGFSEIDEKWLKNLKNTPLLYIGNKLDQAQNHAKSPELVKKLQSFSSLTNSPVLFVSALDKSYRQEILDTVKGLSSIDQQGEQVVLSHARHFENILKAQTYTAQAIEALNKDVGAELVSVELKEALVALQQTLGKHFDDQIMDRVFKEFCIGK